MEHSLAEPAQVGGNACAAAQVLTTTISMQLPSRTV